MSTGKDLAEYIVEQGQILGASYVEARYISMFEEDYTMRNGSFMGITEKERQGLGIRVLVDGCLGFVSTEKFEKEHLKSIIQWVIKQTKSTQRKEPIKFAEDKTEETSWKTAVKQKFCDVDGEEKRFFLLDLDKRLKSEVGKKLNSRVSLMLLYADDKYIVTSEGTKISSENSIFSFLGFNSAKGEKGVEQRMLSWGGTGGWEWKEKVGLSDGLVEDNQMLLKTANEAQKIIFDHPIDVVVGGEVAGIMAHENVGHPSEGDRIIGREGAQAGESFYADLLKDKNLGEIKLGNEAVTIIDDPTLDGGAGYYLYDDEGVKAGPRYLVKKGMLNELLLNREYVTHFGVKSNAAARAISFDKEPITRMANTYFAPGEYSNEELIKGIKEGIYMKSFTEWNIDDRRFQSKYVGLEAYLIKNGELTDTIVKRPILELTTFGLLGSIDAVSKDFFTPSGICGKGEPVQGVPVSMGGAHLRLRNISVGSGA